MTDLISHLALWLVGIFAIGFVTALVTREAEPQGKVSPWLLWALCALAAGLLLSVLGALQGRAAFWLETGVAALAAFLLGAAAGALGRTGHLREHKGWALGLLPAILAWAGVNLLETPKIESALGDKVGAALKNAGGGAPSFALLGRDAVLDKSAPASEAARTVVARVDGLRSVRLGDVTEVDGTVFASAPSGAMEAAKAAADKAMDGNKVEAQKALDAPKTAASKSPATQGAGANGADAERSISVTAKPTPAQKRADAKSVLATLRGSGPLDLSRCQQAVDATQALKKIQFRSGGVSINRAAAAVLDKLAEFLKRCPEAKVDIGGHTDNVGDAEDNKALSQRRADAVLRYLAREGIDAARLSATGYGATQPIASNDDEDGRAENRRIELVLK
jgi:outer membrane protein OmpA-like peptidoglycan-associated protein